MPFPLTKEQREIVEDRGGELLVSAAAGSGKTRVLVERLLDRVTREGTDIDRFLVITYTKAAAAELRTRIAQELSERLAQHPQDRHLRYQTTLVYQAQISTIHSFCSQLLRECGHQLDLDSDFRLVDEGETTVLMGQTLEELLDLRYEGLERDDPFFQLADTLGAGRDDRQLVQIVLDIFGRVQSHPDPAQWLMEQRALWELKGVCDLTDTLWGAWLLNECRRQAQWCKQRLESALGLAERDELLSQNYAPALKTTLEELDEFLMAKTWDQAYSCLPVSMGTVGRKRKRKVELSPMEEERAQQWMIQVKENREKAKNILEKIAETMGGDNETHLEELKLSTPVVQALMDLVLDFQKAYAQEKNRRSLLDFSDLEHLAVKLLLDEAGNPTPLAQSWSQRYDEIMVDEYQDTNQVQNAIFSAISQGGKKLFQVGDVKQSIYRFRLADPTIFLDKYRRFLPGEQAQDGQARKRVLSCNFRSRREVLEGCNDLFRNIMSSQFGELDYTQDQALVAGADFPDGDDYRLEADLLDLSFLGEQDGEKNSKQLLEARFVARRIRQMLDQGYLLSQDGKTRTMRPSDVMILLRSPGTILHHYIRALEEEQIPWACDAADDLFASTEVNVALSILQVVDNPYQDIPLLAALRSPVYGFSADKLAALRVLGDGDFYTVLTRAAEQGDADCKEFLEQLDQLRLGAGDKTCRQLIWHIYEQTNLLGLFGCMEDGSQRQNNLLAFYTLAGRLEESGCRSLFQFLLRLQRLRENGTRLNVNSGAIHSEGVSILSIHKSKGLEKPVVFVADLMKRLNREDMTRPVLFHPEMGVGCKGLEQKRMVEYTTLARRVVARRLQLEMMSEELRLLYVAMTRAREKLILTFALTDGQKTLEKMRGDLSAPVAPVVLEQQMSVGHWVLLHILTRPEAGQLREMAQLPEVLAQNLGPEWNLRWINGETLDQVQRKVKRLESEQEQEMEDREELRRKLCWSYPHQGSVEIPSKLTATQLKGRILDEEIAQESVKLQEDTMQETIYRPQFITKETGLTAGQRGTALHLAMQYIPRQGDHSEQGIRDKLDELVRDGFLTKQQKECVPVKRIAAFYQSKLGQEMERAPVCHQEFKFSMLKPAAEYYPDGGEDEVLLQGVIDAWFEDEQGITVVDFKSDRIQPGEENSRGQEYVPQLNAYRNALSEILGRKVDRLALWFFATNTVVEIEV